MSLMPSSALRFGAALLALVGLAGCSGLATKDDAGTLWPDSSVSDKAPLLPSMLFPGEADSFIGWRCTPDQGLVTATGEDELRLWSAHGAYRLAPAVVASGERYQSGDLSVWIKGDEALVESPKGRLDCRVERDGELGGKSEVRTRQDHPGVMFWGGGNEPGWNFQLAYDKPLISLAMDYGARQVTLPYRVKVLDNTSGQVVLTSGQAARPFELRIEPRACFDDMSGQPWPASVALTLNGQTYRGCGQGIAP